MENETLSSVTEHALLAALFATRQQQGGVSLRTIALLMQEVFAKEEIKSLIKELKY